MKKAWFEALLAALPLLAQAPGEIHGVVLDARGGEPLARVEVQPAGTPARAVTGARGRFRVADLAPGPDILRAGTVGYRVASHAFSLEAGGVREFEIVLAPDTPRQTEAVEVPAGPFDLDRQDSRPARRRPRQQSLDLRPLEAHAPPLR